MGLFDKIDNVSGSNSIYLAAYFSYFPLPLWWIKMYILSKGPSLKKR